MAQHDYSIANQTAASFRTDLNNVLSAIVSNNSGATEPADTYANMFWYDTTANILKIRNEAGDTWVNIGYVDQTADAFRILDDTEVVNTSGTQTGLLGDQATATWETGTETTESLVSPAKVKAAIDANVTTTLVNTAIASSTLGAVGTYAMLGGGGTTGVNPGSTIAGSSLSYVGFTENSFDTNQNLTVQTGTPSGTWRCMGFYDTFAGFSAAHFTLFLRIA